MANEFLDINGLSHFKDKLDQSQADVLRYSSQSPSDAQKAQARTNIGAGTYSKPSGGIPASDLASGVIPEFTDYTDAELQTAIDTAFAGL